MSLLVCIVRTSPCSTTKPLMVLFLFQFVNDSSTMPFFTTENPSSLPVSSPLNKELSDHPRTPDSIYPKKKKLQHTDSGYNEFNLQIVQVNIQINLPHTSIQLINRHIKTYSYGSTTTKFQSFRRSWAGPGALGSRQAWSPSRRIPVCGPPCLWESPGHSGAGLPNQCPSQ